MHSCDWHDSCFLINITSLRKNHKRDSLGAVHARSIVPDPTPLPIRTRGARRRRFRRNRPRLRPNHVTFGAKTGSLSEIYWTVINPLQHIPRMRLKLLSEGDGRYDQVVPLPQLGYLRYGGLFGSCPIGLACGGLRQCGGRNERHRHMGEHLIAALEGPGESAAPTPVQTAAVPSSEVPQQFAAEYVSDRQREPDY